MFDLTGKTAFITGASSGFGEHFAAVLAAAKADLILGARRTHELERVAQGLRAAHGRSVRVVSMDVTDADSVVQGLTPFNNIDILVNNAGIVRSNPALEQTEGDWDAVVDTNLKGAFLVAKTVAGQMRAADRPGSIINIASILGLRQSSSILPYTVAKAGVIQMTKVLALELARFNIRVNALAPGYFDTEINREFWQTAAGQTLIRRIPQRRLGRVADLDGPLLLLASDASLFMTGAVLAIDGGHLVSGL
ncbi:MAG: 2-deoxy-D-gluconate 3-dehydrogenase [Gammaproteobacteria bacterium]|nr:2-deoxy-D-gluconate 3-dehydrogenase [Gammaproteobacteria bacterium]